MSAAYMAQGVSAFLRSIDQIQANLANFSRDLDTRSEKLAALLSAFEKQGTALAEQFTAPKAEANGVDIALQASLSAKNTALQSWLNKVEADRKGRQFMHKYEKYLVVMIFGAVKSGKSTLGNFFGGREFRRAAFDNAYKHIPLPDFQTEENGRESGGIVRDEAGEKWFAEGVTDTTGSIQSFTLSGLCWVDSPGTGALGKDGDKRSMDEMVDEYIPYADMCIFLINSGQPGLQEDMRYMERLSREGQEAVIVITRSDTVEEDVDEAGNLIRKRVPKNPADRQKQEDDMRQRALAAYPIKEEHCQALSVSTLLAKQGIEKGDEQLYRASQLDKLMQILSDKAAGDAARLKEKRPRRAFNAFVDEILGREVRDGDTGITFLQKSLNSVSAAIADTQKAMDNETTLLVLDIKSAVRREFLQEARSWAKSVKDDNSALDGAEVTRRISQILYRVMQTKISDAISRIIVDFKAQELNSFQLELKTAGLQHKTKTISVAYSFTGLRERDPRNLLEHVGSWLGFTYHERYSSTRMRKEVIDLGTNVEEMIDELLPQIEQQAHSIVQQAMQELRESYFKPQENYILTMSKALKQLQKELAGLKFAETAGEV
ncbi:MAG: hypothetical protein Q4F00_09000 [bacterium]|nr:hypothetical protein [bacterium]